MIYVDPTSALLALITLLFIGFYNGFKTKGKENVLKQIERDYRNNPDKIFDLNIIDTKDEDGNLILRSLKIT